MKRNMRGLPSFVHRMSGKRCTPLRIYDPTNVNLSRFAGIQESTCHSYNCEVSHGVKAMLCLSSPFNAIATDASKTCGGSDPTDRAQEKVYPLRALQYSTILSQQSIDTYNG